MEQNEAPKSGNAGNTSSQNDRRTFLIAFLTTVILLALYHFGTGLFAIFSGSSDFCTIPVTREYVLVPVSAMPQHGGMGMMGGPGGGPRGPFRGGPRRGGFFRGGHGGMEHHGEQGGHHPGAPVSPGEAPAAADAADPATVPAAAPAPAE